MRPASLAAYGATVLAAVALDQTTKFLVETGLDMHAQLDVLPFFALFRTHNTGIAFSMLSDFGSIGLVAVTLAVTALILWIAARTEPDQHLARVGFALIVGGALGNLIDRVWHGYVIDFLLFHLPGWSFAIFNLADVFITLGAGMVILDEFLIWRRTRRQ